VVSYAGVPATLTKDGEKLFTYNGKAFYPAGTELDPVTFTIGAKASTTSAGTPTVVATSAPDAVWTPPATPPATTGVTLDKPTYAAGDTVELTATGFTANEPDIKIVVYSTPVVISTTEKADASGKVTWKGVLPSTLPVGTHTLTVQGTTSAGATFDLTEAAAAQVCQIADATLAWGVKESFRSYVSGSIAHGDWTTNGNATYKTPAFTWSKGTGTTEGQDAATIDFTGGVVFTGHDGALDTRLSNPQVRILDAKTALLLVDFESNARDSAESGDTKRDKFEDLEFARLDLSAATPGGGEGVSAWRKIPATLTAQGAKAFSTYAEGDPLDPIDLTFEAPGCAQAAGAGSGSAAAAADTGAKADAGDGSGVPAGAKVVLVMVMVAALAAGGVWWRRRRSRKYGRYTTGV
jgi:hypothetical protein